MNIKEKLKKNILIYNCYNKIKGVYISVKERNENIKSIKIFEIQKKIVRRPGPVRIVFIMQYIPSWGKFEPLYNKLMDDERFEVYLICVPPEIENKQLTKKDINVNETYNYFRENGYEAINAYLSEDRWYDIKQLEPDYVFHSRPYNYFMPMDYNSNTIAKYAKICNIIYGSCITIDVMTTVLNRDYFRNVFCYFAENEESKVMFEEKFNDGLKKGLQKSEYLGLPVYEHIMKLKNEKNDVWNFASSDFKVMWTPRWSTDPEIGGSNFFEYNSDILEYAAENSDISFLLRPHPLMFDNFIKTGEMTAEEVNEYRDRCAKLSNVEIDKNKEYSVTFWNSSLLVTDLSSIIIEYFIMNKPIIYCPSKTIKFKYTKQAVKILECCYIANDWEEVKKYIDMIKRGEDPLMEKRTRYIDELFGGYLYNSTENIINELLKHIS